MRLPVYGVFVAAGLIAALWLSQKSAHRAGLPADRVWDAGFFAAIAAFFASRALLIAADARAFLRYPLQMLALPSLTYGGIMLTIAATYIYLRIKRLPVARVADAWSPCACLLAAVLQMGHWFEGTDAGMPARHWFGMVTPGDTVLGPVWPVQVLAAAAAAALGAWAWRRLPHSRPHGTVAAITLLCGGAAAFVLDFIRQPDELVTTLPLDPGQFVALAAMLAGATAWMLVGDTRNTRPAGRAELE